MKLFAYIFSVLVILAYILMLLFPTTLLADERPTILQDAYDSAIKKDTLVTARAVQVTTTPPQKEFYVLYHDGDVRIKLEFRPDTQSPGCYLIDVDAAFRSLKKRPSRNAVIVLRAAEQGVKTKAARIEYIIIEG